MANKLEFEETNYISADQATDANTPLNVTGLAEAGKKVKSVTFKSNSSAVSEYVFIYDASSIPSTDFQNSTNLLGVFLVKASYNKTIPLASPNGITLVNGLSIRIAASSDGSTAITAAATVDVSFEVDD